MRGGRGARTRTQIVSVWVDWSRATLVLECMARAEAPEQQWR